MVLHPHPLSRPCAHSSISRPVPSRASSRPETVGSTSLHHHARGEVLLFHWLLHHPCTVVCSCYRESHHFGVYPPPSCGGGMAALCSHDTGASERRTTDSSAES